MTNKGTYFSRTEESLAAARKYLEKYMGTPLEQDYREMVTRYERRVAQLDAIRKELAR